ncbi:hypothetical protein PHLGIDRAFT_319975 [Phlebiopsis gigantea 11061_1 CR5-6]|uniref:Uncharacterized protein n=1 Tax=Phlebiopsis gigantea (strain 11061_1 CR5-6) TaxID=745531 RepID=A0A0C3NBU0_PHLG1|nr:hypothetical protein PHLGIDRAFT_319975 [Phlebiopsis gigantea 11061_1 CR5-6]
MFGLSKDRSRVTDRHIYRYSDQDHPPNHFAAGKLEKFTNINGAPGPDLDSRHLQLERRVQKFHSQGSFWSIGDHNGSAYASTQAEGLTADNPMMSCGIISSSHHDIPTVIAREGRSLHEAAVSDEPPKNLEPKPRPLAPSRSVPHRPVGCPMGSRIRPEMTYSLLRDAGALASSR